MASKLCATPLTAIISTGATVIAYYWPKPYTFPALIGVGGLMTVGWSYYKKETLPPVKVGEAFLLVGCLSRASARTWGGGGSPTSIAQLRHAQHSMTAIISTGATVSAYYWPKPFTFPALIGAGGSDDSWLELLYKNCACVCKCIRKRPRRL
jgi:hypothetical protein